MCTVEPPSTCTSTHIVYGVLDFTRPVISNVFVHDILDYIQSCPTYCIVHLTYNVYVYID